jgi:N utilization substance protein A
MVKLVNSEILAVIDVLSNEKGIAKNIVFQAIEDAFAKIASDYYGPRYDIVAKMNMSNGEVSFFSRKKVSQNPQDRSEISKEDALQIDPQATEGEFILVALAPMQMQRISANSVKDLILNRIKSAEKDLEYEEFHKKQGDIVYGVVKKTSAVSTIVGIGSKAEAIIFREGLLRGDNYRVGDKIKAYIRSVQRSDIDCQIILSRTDNDFLAALMSDAVFEIQEGTIEIKAISRDGGSKAKVAVYSSDPRLDAVGACIGPRGSRIKPIVEELCGEKIDIVYWDRDIIQFAKNAILPAKAFSGQFIEELNSIELVVQDDQLKLAIGRGGQNVRLASQLVACNITVVTDSANRDSSMQKFNSTVKLISSALDLDEAVSQFLVSAGITCPKDIVSAGSDKLVKTGVFNEEIAEELIRRALTYTQNIEKASDEEIKDLQIDKDVFSINGITPEIAIKLAQNANVKTVQDIADLSTDEFLEYAELENFHRMDVMKIIMTARKQTE